MSRKKASVTIEPIYTRIGSRIRLFRKELGLTQDDLADVVGLTRVSIVNIENGRQRILAHHLPEFAAALDVETEMLISSQIKRKAKK